MNGASAEVCAKISSAPKVNSRITMGSSHSFLFCRRNSQNSWMREKRVIFRIVSQIVSGLGPEISISMLFQVLNEQLLPGTDPSDTATAEGHRRPRRFYHHCAQRPHVTQLIGQVFHFIAEMMEP